ncbi:MAG TPA: thioredoxin family protein [Rhizomicrobium sp.]|jgi:thiol-disulfide isomerase/thioredoxin|nr:thioredoxin family protein [Rhizomicrobium sp.]
MLVALPPPVLEVFYSPTCAPCRLELPVLAQIVERDGVRLRIVLLDQEQRARDDIRKVSVTLEKVATPPSKLAPRRVLLLADDTDGILPFARSLLPSGKACAVWRGRLTVLRARAMLAACITAPSPR